MKLALKANEHLRISHDGGLGFQVYVEGGILHVRAKDREESYGLVTNIVTTQSQLVDENEGWLVK